MLRGVSIVLIEETVTGQDQFGVDLISQTETTVENVLIAPVSAADIVDTLRLHGKTAIYEIAIPKGDTHEWTDRTVKFFGHKWRTIGMPKEGIEAMIPLNWNKKIQVERYE